MNNSKEIQNFKERKLKKKNFLFKKHFTYFSWQKRKLENFGNYSDFLSVFRVHIDYLRL